MSTSMSPTPVKDSVKARSHDPHKTKKRKHCEEQEEQAARKQRKKLKKSRREEDDHVNSLPEPEASVTKHRKKKKKRPATPSPTGQLTPISPSVIEAPPAAHSTSSLLGEEDAPEIQTPVDQQTTPQQHSPEPFIPDDTTPSPFHSVRLSLYLPLSAISLFPSTALSSLQAEHLAPLLLTYYAPARGIVLAFTNTTLSSTRPLPSSEPPAPSTSPTTTLAHCADDYGVSYTWLTTTFLVFRPARTHTLPGWINISSDGFVGLVAYNHFQAGVAKNRIASHWRWVGPGADPSQARKRNKPRKTIKIRSSDSDGDPMDIDVDEGTQTTLVTTEKDLGHEQDRAAAAEDEDDYDGTGYFVDSTTGSRLNGILPFRVVDVEVVPGHDREKWALHIDATLLSPEDEATLLEEERGQAERNVKGPRGGRMPVMGGGVGGVDGVGAGAGTGAGLSMMMSGALGKEDTRRRGTTLSQTPVPVSSSARR